MHIIKAMTICLCHGSSFFHNINYIKYVSLQFAHHKRAQYYIYSSVV